ncbi:MAG: MauE/DoxX family redox-associated membrane protein [Deltaproteobacteria bacterium]
MKNNFNKILFSKHMLTCVRMTIGFIFIYAGAIKIYDPAGFAQMLNNYDLLPYAIVNTCAIIMPWLEMVLGILLVFGIWFDGCAILSLLFFCVFASAITISIIRGIDVDCGCFSTQVGGSPVSWLTLMRDFLLILAGIYMVKIAYMRHASCANSRKL